MADPVTIGLIALQAAGPIMEGVGANKQARREAAALEQNAIEAGTQGAEDAYFSLREGRMQEGAALAASAAGGIGAGNGTLADMMRANAEARWQQAFNITGAAAKEAANYRSEAKSARSRGKSALFGGIIRAGATVLGGVGDMRAADRQEGINKGQRKQQAQGPAPLGAIPLPRGGS